MSVVCASFLCLQCLAFSLDVANIVNALTKPARFSPSTNDLLLPTLRWQARWIPLATREYTLISLEVLES